MLLSVPPKQTKTNQKDNLNGGALECERGQALVLMGMGLWHCLFPREQCALSLFLNPLATCSFFQNPQMLPR